jgi:microcystin-dependent protein
MSTPYLGEIRFFGGNFAPRNNALATGQIISIQQNTALFSLYGTYYGGNGTTTFALPDLRGRLPVHQGQGPGLSNYTIGEQTGTESVTVLSTQMPMHNHVPAASTTAANQQTPGSNGFATLAAPWQRFWTSNATKSGNPTLLNPNTIGFTGGNQPHENRMQMLAISMIIALQGIFPARN